MDKMNKAQYCLEQIRRLKKDAKTPADTLEMMDTVIMCVEHDLWDSDEISHRPITNHIGTLASHVPTPTQDPRHLNADWLWIAKWFAGAMRAEFVTRRTVGDPDGLAPLVDDLARARSIHEFRAGIEAVEEFMYGKEQGNSYFETRNLAFLKRLRGDLADALEGRHRDGLPRPEFDPEMWHWLGYWFEGGAMHN